MAAEEKAEMAKDASAEAPAEKAATKAAAKTAAKSAAAKAPAKAPPRRRPRRFQVHPVGCHVQKRLHRKRSASDKSTPLLKSCALAVASVRMNVHPKSTPFCHEMSKPCWMVEKPTGLTKPGVLVAPCALWPVLARPMLWSLRKAACRGRSTWKTTCTSS